MSRLPEFTAVFTGRNHEACPLSVQVVVSKPDSSGFNPKRIICCDHRTDIAPDKIQNLTVWAVELSLLHSQCCKFLTVNSKYWMRKNQILELEISSWLLVKLTVLKLQIILTFLCYRRYFWCLKILHPFVWKFYDNPIWGKMSWRGLLFSGTHPNYLCYHLSSNGGTCFRGTLYTLT